MPSNSLIHSLNIANHSDSEVSFIPPRILDGGKITDVTKPSEEIPKNYQSLPYIVLSDDGRYSFDSTDKEQKNGGFNNVYHGRSESKLHPEVALRISIKPISNAEQVSQISNEIALLQRLRHPNIIELLDFTLVKFDDGYHTVYVQPWIDGKDGGKWFEQPDLDLNEAKSVLLDVADALDYSHAFGVIHRDIKPQNIMIAKDKSEKLADGYDKNGELIPTSSQKLIHGYLHDFSLSNSTIEGVPDIFSGTLEYLSPEQIKGNPPSISDDFWALGISIHQMLKKDVKSMSASIDFNADRVYYPFSKSELPLNLQPKCDQINKIFSEFFTGDKSIGLVPGYLSVKSATELVELLLNF